MGVIGNRDLWREDYTTSGLVITILTNNSANFQGEYGQCISCIRLEHWIAKHKDLLHLVEFRDAIEWNDKYGTEIRSVPYMIDDNLHIVRTGYDDITNHLKTEYLEGDIKNE
jgi:hypothetical protein